MEFHPDRRVPDGNSGRGVYAKRSNKSRSKWNHHEVENEFHRQNSAALGGTVCTTVCSTVVQCVAKPSCPLLEPTFHLQITVVVHVLQIGVRADGVKELFGANIPAFKGDLSFTDFQAILSVVSTTKGRKKKHVWRWRPQVCLGDSCVVLCPFFKLKNWENLPTDQPVFTAYSRASGQEWFFTDINKDLIQNIVGVRKCLGSIISGRVQSLRSTDRSPSDLWPPLQAISPDAGKERPLWTVIENLQKGTSWHWTRAFLIFEARFFQATTLGLPVEISKYYEAVNGITTNGQEPNLSTDFFICSFMSFEKSEVALVLCTVAKAAVNPPLTQNLGQLLTSEVALETDGFIG